MTWKFRFPHATLHYFKHGDIEGAVERARDWAISPSGNTRTKKPTFKETEAWIAELLEEEKRQLEAKHDRTRNEETV